MSDRPNMPYVDATIAEIQRLASIGESHLWRYMPQQVYHFYYMLQCPSQSSMPLSCVNTQPTHAYRCHASVPMSVIHAAAYDTTLRGYRIPKGTWIFQRLCAVSEDDRQWQDPYDFKPERFLDNNGKYQRSEHLLPFGLGTNSCRGPPRSK